MHQMKRFDSQGNLIEVVTAQECTKSFWREFEDISLQVHSEESLKNLAGLPIPPTKKRFKISGSAGIFPPFAAATTQIETSWPFSASVNDNHLCD